MAVDMRRSRFAHHGRFQQTVAGKAVGTVQPGTGAFPYCVQTGDIGAAVGIGFDAAAEKMGMSARGYNRIKRLARTIADLRGATDIEMSDLAEALSYRPINRGKYGVK